MFKTALLSWGSGFICVLKILLTVTFELLKGKGRFYPPSLAIWLSDSKSEALGVWEALVSGGTVAMRGAVLVETVPSLASAGEPFRLEAAGPQASAEGTAWRPTTHFLWFLGVLTDGGWGGGLGPCGLLGAPWCEGPGCLGRANATWWCEHQGKFPSKRLN